MTRPQGCLAPETFLAVLANTDKMSKAAEEANKNGEDEEFDDWSAEALLVVSTLLTDVFRDKRIFSTGCRGKPAPQREASMQLVDQ